MRSKIAKRILDTTPPEVRIFTKMYGDIVVRINELIKEKGITQKKLADEMGKKPSEISKWLNGEHNFTLKSLAKLEAELGKPIIQVPNKFIYIQKAKTIKLQSYSKKTPKENHFIKGISTESRTQTQMA